MTETQLNDLDLTIDVNLHGPSVDAGLLAEAVNCVEEEVFRSESEDLKAIGEAFPELPRVAVDAALQRLPLLKGHCLEVIEAKNGSVILGSILTGVVVELLKATVGETVREAWKEGDVHKRLKDFLLRRNEAKVEELRRRVDARLSRQLLRKGHFASASSNVTRYSGGRLHLGVYVEVHSPKRPTRGQVLNGGPVDPEMAAWLRDLIGSRIKREAREF